MTAYIEWLAKGPFYGGKWTATGESGYDASVPDNYCLNARAVGTTGTVTWALVFIPVPGKSMPGSPPPVYRWQQNGFTGAPASWPSFWPEDNGAKFPNYEPRGVVIKGFYQSGVSGRIELRAFDNGVSIKGGLTVDVHLESSGDTYPDITYGVLLELDDINLVVSSPVANHARLPAPSLAFVMAASSTPASLKLGGAQLSQAFVPQSLKAAVRIGAGTLLQTTVSLQPDSLRGGRVGVPSMQTSLVPTSLVRPLRLGVATARLALISAASLVVQAKLGTPSIAFNLKPKSVIARARLGGAVIGRHLQPASLRTMRIGGASLDASQELLVRTGLGPARIDHGTQLHTVLSPMPLSNRVRLGRAVLKWEKQCPC